jgi:flagellar biosynthesis regulator FlaF
MTDSKYFTTTKKGEIFELKSELNSDKKERKREAVKKTIANMTVGKVRVKDNSREKMIDLDFFNKAVEYAPKNGFC